MVLIQFDFGKGEPTVVMKSIFKRGAGIQVRAPIAPKDVRMEENKTQLAVSLLELKR